MTTTDHEKKFLKWKEDTRREALENEVERLKEENQRKEKSFKNLKISFIITGFLILASYAIIFLLLNNNEFEPKDTSSQRKPQPTESATTPQEETTSSTDLSKGQIIIGTPMRDTVIIKVPSDGILFSVQIGAYLGKDLSKYKKNMISLNQSSTAGINQFTLGIFPQYEDAQKFREEVLNLGFKDAYITALRNGERLNTEEAIKRRQEISSNP